MSKCPCALLKHFSLASLTAQAKIVATFVGIVALFSVQQPLVFAVFALICVSLLWSARVSLPEFLRVAKPAAFILLISFVANTLVFIGHPDIIFSGSDGLSVAGFLQKYRGYCPRVACLGAAFIGCVNNYAYAAC